MDRSLTIYDINKIVGRNINLIIYDKIKDYDSIYQLLTPPNYELVILYNTGRNYGHWCCLYKANNGNIIFFDSYGKEIDEQLPYMKKYYTKSGKHLFPLLTNLLLKLPESVKIEYHDKVLQGKTSATCGRWVGFRLKTKNKLSVDEFENMFTTNTTKNDKDIINLTEKYLS